MHQTYPNFASVSNYSIQIFKLFYQLKLQLHPTKAPHSWISFSTFTSIKILS